MSDILNQWYLWLKAIHIIFAITWMAGLFYLPRLFVYHSKTRKGSDQDGTFQVMERKLLKIIMNPSMILVWVFGVLLYLTPAAGIAFDQGWVWTKLIAVILMSAFHMALAKWCRQFAEGKRPHTERFFRKANEIPTVLLFVIVIMVIVRPF